MKLTTFALLSLCMAYVHGCIVNPIADEGCLDDDYIAIITCTEECTCKISDDDALGDCTTAGVTSDVMDALTKADLNGEKCEEICYASTDCIFFRWDKDASDYSHCTLMNKDQCVGWQECERGHCVSGQANCHGGEGTVPPVPDTATCLADVKFVQGSVHWNCRFEGEKINIYGPESVPTGTICQTAHKCAFFNKPPTTETDSNYANELVVECNPAKNADADFLWGKSDKCLYEVDLAFAENHASLIDPLCGTHADDLVLAADKLNEPGVSLVCENAFKTNMDLNQVTVTDPNACVLLCNSHHVFSFESELAKDGTGVWNRYDVGSDIGEVLDKDEVKCWDFMEM